LKTDFAQITEILNRMHGVDISKYDVSFLNKSLQKRFVQNHCHTAEEYFSVLEQNRHEGEIFIASLHISYSEFYRNPLTYSVLERIVIPLLLQKRKNTNRNEIRIWSAACAAGQEAYSLAMLMEERKCNENNILNYRIFATDLYDKQLIKAQSARYHADSLNNLSMKRVAKWFTRLDDTYLVKPELKANVAFSAFDLLNGHLNCPQASIFGDFDLVVCANLLFYYKAQYQKLILDKASNCLSNGGYLIVGETERDIVKRYNYQEVFPQTGIFQRKD